jgi:hypothetical protein
LKSLEISSSVVDPGVSVLIISDLSLPVNLAKPVLVIGMLRISAQTDSILAGSEPQCGVARKKIAAVDVRMLEKRLESTTVMLIAFAQVRYYSLEGTRKSGKVRLNQPF